MHRIMRRTRFSRTRRAAPGLAAAFVLCIAAVPPAHAVRSGEPRSVTCRVRDDPRGRLFQLRRSDAGAATKGGGWALAMRDAESRETWIAIALPGAKPALTATTATLTYRNANGGRQVELAVSQAGSRLEVWVDHGLEVNIEPDLDPRVDRLGTDGVLTNIDCTIDGG